MKRPKTNRLLMLLLGAAIAGCASQTERSSSGGGDQTQAAAEPATAAPPSVPEPTAAYEPEREPVQYIDRPVEETPPPKAVAAAAVPKDEALPDFPITKYELPEEPKDEDVEDLGPQEDESVSAEQDATPAEESSVGETTQYGDEEEAADSGEIEELGPQEDESVSAQQDPLPAEESSVGETTEYADEPAEEQKEIVTTGNIEELGPLPDESGTVTYPEEKRAAADRVVGETTAYPDEPAAPQKSAAAAANPVSVSFETEPLFGFDKANIRSDQASKLDEFISSIGGTQYDSISVVGHADRIGPEAYNQKLSERRAEAVKAYLVRKGVPADRIQAEGRGESDPMTGDTCARTRGKALISCLQPDRRVDVSVSATKPSN